MKVWLRALFVLVAVLVCFFAVRRVSAQGSGVSLAQTFCTGSTPCVLTYHNDNSRGGVNPNETIFSPTTDFSKLQAVTYTTDGLIYAQPLYIEGLYGSNQKVGACPPANVAFVATENNSVYALEAPPFPPSGGGNVCWMLNLNNTQAGETAIPYTSLPTGGGAPCKNLTPWVGITGTPVIDASVTPPILYVVTSHQKGTGTGATFAERLHAIDTTTGLELSGSTFDIDSALSGFNVTAQNQRPGLALTHPSGSPNLAYVYVAWASNCDYGNSPNFYDGWVAGFKLDYNNLSSGFSVLGSFTSEPVDGKRHDGGIWMAGSAPAIDSNGNVYVAVGNGDVKPPSQTSAQWGNSVLKLSYKLAYEDFYMPNDWAQLNNGSGTTGICFAPSCPPGPTHDIAPDTDMGTGGVVLLNNSTSPSELVSVGKQGMAYVIPYDTSTSSSTTMGGLDGCGYNCSAGSDPTAKACTTTGTGQGNIVQCFAAVVFDPNQVHLDRQGVWGAPAFWSGSAQNQYLFTIGLHDYVYWYAYNGSNSPPFTTTNPYRNEFKFCATGCVNSDTPVGGTVSVTWDGGNSGSGITWALDSNAYGSPNPNGLFPAGPAVLRAYKAAPDSTHCPAGVCNELWDSTQLTGYTTLMPGAVKFTVPTIVDGYILVGGGSPSYFKLHSPTCPPPPPSGPPTQLCDGQLTILGIAPK